MEKSIMKLLLMMILMFGVAESRTALVLGTNYSTISSANDWEDDWASNEPGFTVDLGYFMGGRIGVENVSNGLITGLTYSQRGFMMTGKGDENSSESGGEISFKLDYLTGYALIQVPLGSLALLVGGEGGYYMSGEIIYDINGSDKETEEINDEMWEEAGGHTLDYGLVFGAKFNITPKLSAVGTYYFGLPEWGEDGDYDYGIDYKNRALQIYLSYEL